MDTKENVEMMVLEKTSEMMSVVPETTQQIVFKGLYINSILLFFLLIACLMVYFTINKCKTRLHKGDENNMTASKKEDMQFFMMILKFIGVFLILCSLCVVYQLLSIYFFPNVYVMEFIIDKTTNK